jgi:iron complex outermembrane receptor protein
MYYEDQLAVNGALNLVGEYLRVNIPRSYRVGLEVDGAWQFGKRWLLEGNATLSQNKIPSFTEFVDVYDENFSYQGQQAIDHEDTDLAFSPDVIAFGGLTYRFFTKRTSPHKLDVSLLNKYVARQYLDLTSSEASSLDPYFFTDLRLQYALKTNWVSSIELTLMVRNLLDAQIETNGWAYRFFQGDTLTQDVGLFPQAGTNFLLGATVRF